MLFKNKNANKEIKFQLESPIILTSNNCNSSIEPILPMKTDKYYQQMKKKIWKYGRLR